MIDLDVVPLENQQICVRLTGRLDSQGIDRIEAKFSAAAVAGGRPVAVDMTGVDFMASMGIRMLISSARALRAKGGKMVMFGAQPAVAEVMKMVALDKIIPLFASQAEAVDALKS